MDIHFGHYRLKRAKRQLLGPDGPVELPARCFDILGTLLNKAESVVGKTELFDSVWPDMVVGDNTLQVQVSALRKALDPGMIVTVHGRGYKYAGPRPVEVDTDDLDGSELHGSLTTDIRPADRKTTIAVLSFSNMSGDPDQEYFSDGITEDLITELSRYRPLAVVSRHSSACFKGTTVDIKEIGSRLGAHYVVEGSVRKIGASVRVTAQLIETVTARHIWAERYDRMAQDLFAVHDELVRRLVSAIVGQVEQHTETQAKTKRTESLDAYDLWLRAMHGSDVWTLDGNAACERLLEEAINKDPMFARAHASLAFCHIRTSQMSPGSPNIRKIEEAALRSAEQAVRLDAAEARAHHALGWSHLYLGEFERARSRFAISASLNPNDASLCIDRALALAFLGEQNAADEAAEIAAILHPLGGDWFSAVRAIVHVTARRYDAAEEYFALAPRTWPDILAFHAANLTYLGDRQRASELMRQALERFGLLWCGSSPAVQYEDFIGWFFHVNMFRRREDREHVDAGLPKADLIAAARHDAQG
ncbi:MULTISPECIES: winged helix-turn-helix domain-containing protein [unclassified Mesorhizobium]|uniref:winged helix-turn-helix domain-containing tetratricopeptide repeat protein n=1 Tax=unclassified Mesorhizobium TaxID=325217 RepID=UPI0003CF6DA8|nr:MULTISPECIES: winged helix-turn-helix domain-containing protein [unclassified Mesorhizobium]ESY51350.1 adenylate cyclase [Mesorhizobium sp. LNJC374B00]ESY56694.1 adenylate cyclase [Mesorhizobium sp. LNJC372A00]WJI81984.1 winged helix-turn-helix domain-containing protein [Mesorhizobium sp. C374B]WJI88503.1 winged helix-turn-helix domain-containing protein [Mesorhizobium sp. C372A]